MEKRKGGRPKNQIPSRKVNLSGFVSPVHDADMLEWIDSLPERKKFSSIWNIVKIVINLAITETGNGASEIKDFIDNGPDRVTLDGLKKSVVSLKLRWEILERDHFRCVVCGRNASDGVKLHVDHIHPSSKGGSIDKTNLATLCSDCNIGKSDQVSEQNYVEVVGGFISREK